MRDRSIHITLALITVLMTNGCSSYRVPGGPAEMSLLGFNEQQRDQHTDAGIRNILDRKPLAAFPTAIAVARVQASGYSSYTAESWGHGNYSIITVRDVETEDQLQRIADLDGISQIGPINRLMLREKLQDDFELREAAARMHADMLLVYTFDTTFDTEDHAAPLTLVTLGLFPSKNVRLATTASAVLMDTRSGYIYGAAEASAKHKQIANAWTDHLAVDQSRRKTETTAFEKLVGEFEDLWPKVMTEYSQADSISVAE